MIPYRAFEGPVFPELDRFRPASGDDLSGFFVGGVVEEIGGEFHSDEILSLLLPDFRDLDQTDGDVLQTVDLLFCSQLVRLCMEGVLCCPVPCEGLDGVGAGVERGAV
jgi:hypothetical protein